MKRFLVAGTATAPGVAPAAVEGVVLAEDAQHAEEVAEKAGLRRVTVVAINRAVARARGVYSPKRRARRTMAVPRGSA